MMLRDYQVRAIEEIDAASQRDLRIAHRHGRQDGHFLQGD